MGEPLTATELRLRLAEDTRKELLQWLQEGDYIGRPVELHISHFNGGELGKFVCEIKEWKF